MTHPLPWHATSAGAYKSIAFHNVAARMYDKLSCWLDAGFKVDNKFVSNLVVILIEDFGIAPAPEDVNGPCATCGGSKTSHRFLSGEECASGHVPATLDVLYARLEKELSRVEQVHAAVIGEAREVRTRLEKELDAARQERDEAEREVASLKAYIAVQEKEPGPSPSPCQRPETDATFRPRVVQAVELATGARLDSAGAALGVRRFCYDSVAHALNVILGTPHCGGWTDGDSIVDQRHDKRPVTCPDCNAIPF